jgi:transcriptional regulator with XRE-family HTH domain
MSGSLGELLKQWRRERGLSLGGLAARAGVATGTLSGWERGLHLPRLPELDAVLTALTIPPVDRQAALALIDAPRAHRSLARLPSSDAAGLEGDQPVPGHLLRALRLRRGLSLEALAREVGVDCATVSRWERSLNTPSIDQLDRLLAFLGAHLEERLALTTGRCLLWPPTEARLRSLDEVLLRFEELWGRVDQGDRRLLDLEFLVWQAEVWPLAARSAAARELLGRAWSYYAEWLTWGCRMREANSYATRAIDLLQAQGQRTLGFIGGMRCAVQVCARVTAQGKAMDARAAAVDRLGVWLPEALGSEWEADLYRHMAEHAWWAGRPDAAVAFSKRACSLAERLEDTDLVHLTRCGRADVFLRLGQPHEALALLLPPNPNPYGGILDMLRWVQARQDVGEHSAAADWLGKAYALIELYDYPQFRAQADALARRF